MRVRWYDPTELGAFAELARPLLAADPVRHTDTLAVLARLRRGGIPGEVAALVTVHDGGGAPVGALLRTPGRPALVSAVRPEHAAAVDAVLAERDPLLAGVTGPRPAAEAFTAAHTARTGRPAAVDMRMWLLALGELAEPAGVAGAARPAGGPDVELLSGWLTDFRAEATPTLRDPQPVRERVLRGLLGGDRQLLWEVDGRPVALAVAQREVAGMTRIGPVYTPPGHRGRGYGGAVTAAAARCALAGGSAHVVLFVDQANPVSNRLYTRLGFRPVHESVELSFAAEPPRT